MEAASDDASRSQSYAQQMRQLTSKASRWRKRQKMTTSIYGVCAAAHTLSSVVVIASKGRHYKPFCVTMAATMATGLPMLVVYYQLGALRQDEARLRSLILRSSCDILDGSIAHQCAGGAS